jgi:hypothetical protein
MDYPNARCNEKTCPFTAKTPAPNVPTEPGDYYVTFRAKIEDNHTHDTDAPDYIILNSEVFPFLVYTRDITAHFERIKEES